MGSNIEWNIEFGGLIDWKLEITNGGEWVVIIQIIITVFRLARHGALHINRRVYNIVNRWKFVGEIGEIDKFGKRSCGLEEKCR